MAWVANSTPLALRSSPSLVLNNLSSHGTELVRRFCWIAFLHPLLSQKIAAAPRASRAQAYSRGEEVIVLNSENGKTRNVPFSSGSSKVLQCAFCTVKGLDLLVVCTMQGVQVRDHVSARFWLLICHTRRRCAYWTGVRMVRSKSSSSSRCPRCRRPPDKVRRARPVRVKMTSIGHTCDRTLERRRCHVCEGHRRGRRWSGYLRRCVCRAPREGLDGLVTCALVIVHRLVQAAQTARCSSSS